MQRRKFTKVFSAAALSTLLFPLAAKAKGYEDMTDDIAGDDEPFGNTGLPQNLPENIQKLIAKVMAADYKKVNTDWFGSIQIEGLLRFAKRGYKEGLDYANNWFTYHVEHDKKLTDEEYYKQYEGNRARIFREGPLAFALYSANLGVAFPVHELYNINKNADAKTVCFNVADAILQYAARDRFGMLAHDDFNFTEFAIPDTAYWATRANAIAASLCTNKEVADIYWKQAIFQLEQGTNSFLDRDKGLVRTGLFKGLPGQTYWCRSQGWLLWAMAGLLRYLPSSHPAFTKTAADMQLIADGLQKYQSPAGAWRVLADDASTPEEVTGTCMVLSALKEASRKKWIDGNRYGQMLQKAWNYTQQSVDKEGNVHNAYTGWAVPAEKKQTNMMDERFMGFVPGIVMLAADEMTR
jgi:rhamnogalacturonyl hydrolase YesR